MYRFVLGYIRIEISGQYPEQLLNLAAANRISVWGLCRMNGKLCLFLTAKSFFKLRSLIRGLHLRIRVLEKRGLPFLVRPYRYRYGLFFGAVLFLSVLYLLSNFVWIIDVEGNRKTDRREILRACQEIDIHIGVPKGKINSGVQSQKLLLNCPTLSWAHLNVEGSVLTVNVSERKDRDKNKVKLPCNLKASEDAIIEKIDVTSGNPIVSVGQTVAKGEILVSGVMNIGEQTVFCAAEGSVMAQVRMKFQESQPLKFRKSVENGRVFKRYGLDFFGVKIPLYVGSIEGNLKIEKKRKTLKLFERKLPIGFVSAKFYELIETTTTITPETAEKMCIKRIEEKIKNEKLEDYSILEQKVLKNPDKIVLETTIEAKKNIAIAENILFDEEN